MRKSRPSGLTLVELLAALAVSALLASAALAVVVALPRSKAAARGLEERASQGVSWSSLLAADISHARLCRVVPGGFEVRVHSALDPRTLEICHLDATVAWRVRCIKGTPWLVRTQRSTDGRSFSDLVAPGVSAINVAAAKGDAPPDAEGWRVIPEALAVTARFETPGSVPAVFTYCSE